MTLLTAATRSARLLLAGRRSTPIARSTSPRLPTRMPVLMLGTLLALPFAVHAEHHGHDPRSQVTPGGMTVAPTPDECPEGMGRAVRGTTVSPGSPSTEGGLRPTPGHEGCAPLTDHHPSGKTTDPGSRGTQGGPRPVVPGDGTPR